MSEEELNRLAIDAAEALHAVWSIGGGSMFCDSFDWDEAEDDQIAEVLKPFLIRAFNTTRSCADGF